MSDTDPYTLEVEWGKTDRPGLPRMIGPFTTHQEAREWAHLNAQRATWTVHRLAHPHMRSADGSDLHVSTQQP